jgi:hypothetical protein
MKRKRKTRIPTISTKMRMKRRKRKTKTGSKSRLCCVAFALLAISSALAAGEQRSGQTTPEAAALIGVSVFREPGFAVAGAALELTPAPAQNPDLKMKPIKGATDNRGEFVFRVAPSPARYIVRVRAKALKSQQKEVSVQGEGRVDATFILEPESKQ